MDEVLKLLKQKRWTLGACLQDLFSTPKVQKNDGNPQTQTQMVSKFLQGNTSVNAQDIVELMYNSRYSAPKVTRDSQNRSASEAKRPDEKKMARWGLRKWALEIVEATVNKEAEAILSKEGGFHLANEDAMWDSVFNFSLGKVLCIL
jgi:hypothetical protein